jgi:multisubunit Na+/H+ antiporter MnhG subunit
VPYGFSFCQDWKNQFIRPTAIRTTKTAYAWSKVIAAALSGFACVFLGFVLTTLTMLVYMPVVGPDFAEYGYELYSPSTIGSLMMIHPLLFLLAQVCMLGWACMFWAVFALLVSSYCANIFVVLAAPVVAYEVIGATLNRWLPTHLQFDNILFGSFDVGGPWLSVLYVMVLYSALSAVCGLLFCRKVKRRLANG